MMDNKSICSLCGEEARYDFDGKKLCRPCARKLLEELRAEYRKSEDIQLGWKIDDLWKILTFDADFWGPNEFHGEWEEMPSSAEETAEDEWTLSATGEDARELVRDFVAERLHGKLHGLVDFDFRQLADDEKYGNELGRAFDADDTLLARAIYVLAWGDVFPDLILPNVGSGKKYRGDTMNTFHTMFGREDPEHPGHFFGLENYHPDETLRQTARDFQHKVSTIGNFVVLPNNANKCGKTLNTYRGCHTLWRDYFDQFMVALETVLSNGPAQDAELQQLVRERNGLAFEKYTSTEGFRKLSESLFLNDYIEENGHAFLFNTCMTGKVMYHWMKPRPADEEYLKGAKWYARNAIQIIHARAERIVNFLADKL